MKIYYKPSVNSNTHHCRYPSCADGSIWNLRYPGWTICTFYSNTKRNCTFLQFLVVVNFYWILLWKSFYYFLFSILHFSFIANFFGTLKFQTCNKYFLINFDYFQFNTYFFTVLPLEENFSFFNFIRLLDVNVTICWKL